MLWFWIFLLVEMLLLGLFELGIYALIVYFWKGGRKK